MNITWEFTTFDALVLLGIIPVIAIIFIIRLIIKKLKAPSGIDKKFVKQQWKKIEQLISYGKEMNYKLAVIEADKLLDYVLKQMHFPGKTMAERLKLATYQYPKLQSVWWAHKVRNLVVHDVRYHLRYGESRKVLSLFKNALKDLNVL